MDYKFFCFSGRAKLIQLDVDRYGKHTRVFYDVNWVKQPFSLEYPLFPGQIDKPENLDKMIAISEKLSNGLLFARIDLYSLPSIKFGEITFYPGNGHEVFTPSHYDRTLGDMLLLPDANE